MIVTAKVIAEAYDNQTARHYYPGWVDDFDTDAERLTCLTTPGGIWVFQYPGHEGKAPVVPKEPKPPASQPAIASQEAAVVVSVPKKQGRPLSAAHKAKLLAGRAARKAKLAEAAA